MKKIRFLLVFLPQQLLSIELQFSFAAVLTAVANVRAKNYTFICKQLYTCDLYMAGKDQSRQY